MQRQTQNQQSTLITLKNSQQKVRSDIHIANYQFPQTNLYNCQSSNASVLVYLHSHNKKSLKVQLSPKISLFEIKNIVEQKIGIKRERQIVYLNGKNITQYGNIHLQHFSIIHISSTDQICISCQEIHLRLTIINSVDQNQSKIYKNFVALSTDRISDFLLKIEKELNQLFKLRKQNIRYYLLQSSRLLQTQKTFLQQNFRRYSDIICMITRNQVQTRFTNDTQEEIFHDISELLGFGEDLEIKKQLKKQEGYNQIMSSVQQIKSQQFEKQNQQQQFLQSATCQPVLDFKKKKAPFFEGYSQEDTSNIKLANKLRLFKKKKDLDLLNSRSQQKIVFQSSQSIKLLVKPEGVRVQSDYTKEKATTKLPKQFPQIPKGMPVNERSRIRLEIEKLFNFDESSKAKDQRYVETLDAKEQKSPISPPTEVPRQKQKMRLSMGSRSSLVAQLRSMNLQ